MMRVHIAHEFAVRSREGARLASDKLHDEGVRLMDALLKLEACNEDIEDATTYTDALRGIVTAELLVTADNEMAAVEKSLTIIRTAIHDIGGATPSWNEPVDQRSDYQPKSMQLAYA